MYSDLVEKTAKKAKSKTKVIPFKHENIENITVKIPRFN